MKRKKSWSVRWSAKSAQYGHCGYTRNFFILAPPSYPPQTHTFLKRPFLTDFKKYTHTPPQSDEILVHWTKSSQNGGKMPKPTVLAHNE